MVKGRHLNFIVSNLRRSKWQVLAISVLIVLASALVNIILFLSSDYQQSFFREKERLNGGDIDFLLMNVMPNIDYFEQLNETLEGIEEIKDFEVSTVVTSRGSVEYKDAVAGNNISFMSYDDAMQKKIGRFEMLEYENTAGVCLSYIFKKDCGYEIGNSIKSNLGAKDYEFKIAGFYNSVDTGTTNCTDIILLLPEDEFNGIVSKVGSSYRVNVKLRESEKADILEAEIAKQISNGCPGLTLIGSSNYKKLSTSRYITATLFEAIISASAALMIIVILATIAITLSNYIRNNIRNLGALKALGYTSNDLIYPIAGEFSVIALAMSLIGVASSYAVLPILNSALEKQVGIPYKVHFLPVQALLTILICVLVSAFSAFFSVLKIKRIYPISAIRDSKSGKSQRHNFSSLEKTRLGLNTALSLKSLIAGKTHGIMLLLSMIVIAFLLGFSAFTYQNVILDQTAILDLVCGQRTDSVLSVTTNLKDGLLSELDKDASVKRYYQYSAFPITPKGLSKIYAYVVDEDYTATEQLCVRGRMPESDNEIAINRAYAFAYNLEVGDKLSFETEGGTEDFVVTGMIQGAFYSGYDCFVTTDGYSRIAVLPYVSYYVDLKDGADIDEFNARISEKCKLLSCSNYSKSIESVSSSYINILIISTIVVVVLSYIVVAFILYILVSVLLANKHREHGILKSLGFVTKDIVYQTVFFNLPSCVLGTVIGLALSRNGAAKILTLALTNIGIFSFGTPTKFIYLLISGLSVIIFTIFVSILMCGSVRRITPHDLFNRE